jgi:predicted nuclease of predicted toxin-antitoxin system
VKFKLDENLGQRGAQRLTAAGHDVSTIAQQQMIGSSDSTVFEVCAAEGRALVTLDSDFSQVLRFPPEQSAGVAVLASSGRMTSRLIELLLGQLLDGLKHHELSGRLWIVEPGRIRIHGNTSD